MEDQQANGLFFHNINQAQTHWGRGNGMWRQVIDMPDNPSNWEESSGTAMFTYDMVGGVKRGVQGAETYVPVIENARN